MQLYSGLPSVPSCHIPRKQHVGLRHALPVQRNTRKALILCTRGDAALRAEAEAMKAEIAAEIVAQAEIDVQTSASALESASNQAHAGNPQPAEVVADMVAEAAAQAAAAAQAEAQFRASASMASNTVQDTIPAASATTSGPETASSEAYAPIPSATPGQGSRQEDFFASDELMQELTDSNQLGQRGEAWFFAQMSILALIVFPPLAIQGLVDLLGILAVTSGLVFLAYALLSLGRNFSPMTAPRRKHRLITSGMYSYVRHPMYAGLLLAAIGLAAITRSETRLALAVLLWYVLEQKVVLEERALLERYPGLYDAYKQQVAKFFPYIY